MMDVIHSNVSSPESTGSSSSSDSVESVPDASRFSDYGGSPGTPLSSPEAPNSIQEPKSLLSMYTNIEVGVVASLDRRDQYLITLAQAKRAIAKAERKLARCRAKETSIRHRLQCIDKELAESRLSQADVNLERAKFHYKSICGIPRLVGMPSDILDTLSQPSFSVRESLERA